MLLIEAGRLGSGASGGAAGLLLPEAHAGSDPEPFVTLARSSLELWKELEQTVPGVVGLIELDWIGLRAGPGGSGGVLIGRQARVNPLRALARLAATVPLIAAGATARSAKKGSRVVTVATSAGDIHPGAVVFATGMPPLLDGLAPGPPGRRVTGHLLVTEPSLDPVALLRHLVSSARSPPLRSEGRSSPVSAPCLTRSAEEELSAHPLRRSCATVRRTSAAKRCTMAGFLRT